MRIQLKRAYAVAESSDGFRVLVDRIWPRGISKERLRLDLWEKDVAPSNELRKWFGHDPEKWMEFQRRYWRELDENPAAMQELIGKIKGQKVVTLLYGAKDEEHNQAVALLAYLKKHHLA